MPLNFILPSENPFFIRNTICDWQTSITKGLKQIQKPREKFLFLFSMKLQIQDKLSNLGNLQFIEKIPAEIEGKKTYVESFLKLNENLQVEFKNECENLLKFIETVIEIIWVDSMHKSNEAQKIRPANEELYDIYINCCEINREEKPNLELLINCSDGKVDKNKWSRMLTNTSFYFGLLERLETKWRQSKKKKDFWLKVNMNYAEFYGKKALKKWYNKHRPFQEDSLDTIKKEDENN